MTSENASVNILTFQIDMVQNHYPERLYKIFVVNMGWFQRTIWFAVKPFVKESTKKKINLIGDDNEEIIRALTMDIDLEVIPIDLGGKNPI